MASTRTTPQGKPHLWWSLIIPFCGVHVAAAYGVYCRPMSTVPTAILVATIVVAQLANFGITVGYHRLFSHRSFNTSVGVRAIFALMGASATQGSIKWWVLRHRLHHRFIDDEDNDPYCATRGLVFSHCGWLFYKPKYPKLYSIEREDLDQDPVVRWQNEYFVLLSFALGFLFPTVLGAIYGDPMAGLIYPSLLARVIIWHFTFLVNSLAHWDGLQPYSDENTSRSNFLLAFLTAGEGNHNFHSFPQDYRSGPEKSDWDPSKWLIFALGKLGLAWGLRRASPEDVTAARLHMLAHGHDHKDTQENVNEKEEWTGPTWTEKEMNAYIERKGACALLMDGYIVDVTEYAKTHPGGVGLLRRYAIPVKGDGSSEWKEADWAFNGGMNKHTQMARQKMRQLRVALLKMT